MGWRAQVGSKGGRLDCKASSEPTESCDCQTLLSTQCHFRFNYTPSQMVSPTVKLGKESLPFGLIAGSKGVLQVHVHV